ncbi:MAG: glycine--tRNA ligase subunit beta [Deltaproteobacteria bacterium]|nr:glycine--tRNA ligase subunit beta [Deltaproteobacteria bacterium]
MSVFLLEIGAEELPARFLNPLEAELRDKFSSGLRAAGLEYAQLEVYSTPRRAVVCLRGLAEKTRAEDELVIGPPARIGLDADGKPSKAGEGFARTQQVDFSEVFTVKRDKGEYLAARKKTGGEDAGTFLARFCPEAINSLSFPKRMRWGSGSYTYARPLRWIVALLDAQVVNFSTGGVQSGRGTFGRRAQGAGFFELEDASRYFAEMPDKGKVMVSAAERRALIIARGDRLAQEAGGTVIWKDSLLDEVQGLCEYPVPLLGSFDASFLEIPAEVLLTSMETHQKSFGLRDARGQLLPYFLTVLNIEPEDESPVRKGWERVLRARLEDGKFFWKSDLAADFDDWLGKLDKVIFMDKLGSMGDKSRRLGNLLCILAGRGPFGAETLGLEEARRAGRLSKADLVSEMVGEFDTLQGIMGSIYAGCKGESPEVARALAGQYLPAGQDSPLPESLGGSLLSIADKADTLAGCFALGLIPTGASDPFALRRCALGIARILEEKKLRLDVDEIFQLALEQYDESSARAWKLPKDKILGSLGEFFSLRLKNLFMSKGADTLLVEAILAAGYSDVWAASARLAALRKFSFRPDFSESVLTFKRAANIIRKQGQEEPLTGQVQKSLLLEPAEKNLAANLESLLPNFERLWGQDDFEALLDLLYTLKPAVDRFFQEVMVMCEDKTLRLNRLNLLAGLVNRLRKLADFDALQM